MGRNWWTAALCALVAGMAGGARAQDAAADTAGEAAGAALALPTLTVEGTAATGFYGQTFAGTAAGVLKSDAPIAETPRSVSVVTQQQMQDRDVRSVADALQYTPGVTANGGNDNRGDWVQIRGFDPRVYLDGMQSFFGYYNNVRPEPFLLSSIEVLKGPSALQFGNGPVGGIVNETSKLPDPSAPNIVELTFGTQNLFQAGIDYNGASADGKLLYRLVGMGRTADGYVNFSNDDAQAFAPSVTWAPTGDTSLTLLATYQKNDTSPYIQFLSPYGTLYSAEDFGNGDFLPGDVFVGEPEFNHFNGQRKSVSLFGEHRFDEIFGMAGSLRYTESKLDYAELWWAYDNFETGRYNTDGTINRSGERAYNDSRSLIGDLHGTADFDLAGASHSVLFGAAFTSASHDWDSYDAFITDTLDPFNPVYDGAGSITLGPFIDRPTVDFTQRSLYAQDQMVFAGRLHVDLGLRYDWLETTAEAWESADSQVLKDHKPSFSAGVLYAFDNGLAPYVSYSESLFQEAYGTNAQGNAFEPTRGTQYEAGVKYQPPGTSTLFTAAAFEITKSNLLESDPLNPNFSVQTGEATSRGVELGAQGTWQGLTFDLAYTHLNTEGADGATLAGVPDDAASAWLQYTFAGALDGLEAGAGIRYVGSTLDAGSGVTTPSVTLYDAMLAYSWEGYRISVVGRNLADKTYTVNCNAYNCYYGDPRTVAVSLTAAF
ncbi:MAG: TonB-dependent siderophore receptor [Amaricoccus sp.]|uniref:TonB-dependent siderophore receptor n=1 Tax=Amaricoccus sp. TaxID=1872485 RepID=UPI0039E4D3CB